MGRFLTADIPPVRAAFREAPEDFEVDEVPLYPASGAGTHVYLTIEKRSISTMEAIRRIATHLGRRPEDFGHAGLKDARAVARQRISIEHADAATLAGFEDDRVRVVAVERHANKIKVGHLAGNVFRIALRGASDADERAARAALDRLARAGVPNRFGRQRFGSTRAATHLLGHALLRGTAHDLDEFIEVLLGRPDPAESPRVREARARFEAGDRRRALDLFPREFRAERAALEALLHGADAARAIAAIGRKERELYVHAAQADLFNALLDERLERGALGILEEGDVVEIHAKGACFLVEDPAREQARADAFEISPAGPLFGTKLFAARGAPAEREARVLAAAGLSLESFRGGLSGSPRGGRRPYRVPLREVSIVRNGDALRLSFFLPAGSYATAVVAELKKEDVA